MGLEVAALREKVHLLGVRADLEAPEQLGREGADQLGLVDGGVGLAVGGGLGLDQRRGVAVVDAARVAGRLRHDAPRGS